MTLVLRSYRARYDDGSESAATWRAPVDTSWAQYPGRPFRLRYVLQRLPSAGELSSLTDDFAGPSINPDKWVVNDGAAIASGQLVAPCVTSYSGVTSTYTYSMVGSHAAVRVVQTPTDSGGSTETALSFIADASNQLIIDKQGATALYCAVRTDGVDDGAYATWNATSMAWWRVRESGGTVYFETSPDGTTWTTRHSAATPAFATQGKVQLYSGYWGTETSPGSAIFDDFNLYSGGPPTPPTTTTDWQTWYSLNGGSWTPVTGSSSVVRATASVGLVENTATTQQVGSGSFVAGSTDETDGYYGSTTLAVDQQTELEGCLRLVPGDVSPGDSVAIIITRGNFDFLEIYRRTPTLTVAAYPVTYWDGSAEQPASVTVWDGSAEQPMTLLEVV